MWDIKSIVFFICYLFVVILISLSMANAEEKKITPKEFATTISEVPNKVGNFLTNEVEKTKDFQKKSWAEANTKWPWNKIFKGKDNE